MSIIATVQKYFEEISKNQFLSAALALYGAGVLTFLLKSVPSKFINFVKKHTTTSLTIANFNLSYYNLLSILEKENIVDKIRRVRFQNGKWGDNDKIKKGVGIGSHVVWFRKTLLMISVSQLDNKGYEEKLEITLTKFGRSHKFFEKLKEDLMYVERDLVNTPVYTFDGYNFNLVTSDKNRSLSSVFISKTDKADVIKSIETFLSSEQWYVDHGIPYQLGILLEGQPGTGKTSLIKALAGYFHYNVCILSVSYLSNIQQAMRVLPKRSFLVIEDIDTYSATHQRAEKKELSDANVSGAETREDRAIGKYDAIKEFVQTSLSDLLNSIDGLLVQSGRILFMTTNHIEKLDSALIRPGRVDIQLHIGYATVETFKDFLKSFFPDRQVTKTKVKENITMSKLQGLIMKGKDFDFFVDEFMYD